MKQKGFIHRNTLQQIGGVAAIATMLSLPTATQAQVTLRAHRQPLSAVVSSIQKQVNCKFFYNDEVAHINVSPASVRNVSLRSALDAVFRNTDIAYTLDGTNVYLKRREENTSPQTPQRAQSRANHKETITGVVVDEQKEPLVGVTVTVEGTQDRAVTDIDGRYTIVTDVARPTLVFSYIGLKDQSVAVAGRKQVNVTMLEDNSQLSEVVVTALGIQRKESSLTYATQRVKAEDLMKVQEQNVANSLEGKVAGITVTPSAGGAGGASKIVLRGNKSIMGNSTPLIVVDGIPMSNGIRGQRGFGGGEGFEYANISEGSNPLSLINPDDIESMNVLKGANAAALYGSQAANGVIMITTKTGREGKMEVTYTSNVTMDTPLMTPQIQGVYGALVDGNGFMSPQAWGGKITDRAADQLTVNVPWSSQYFKTPTHAVQLRNYNNDDVRDFFRTGVTTNNSVSVSAGTEKSRSYLSMANSYAQGMVEENAYTRNTINFRQTYNFFNRLKVDASINYAQTITRNRPGGGTMLNPIFHLYMTPRNVDMQYYRDNYAVNMGQWYSRYQSYYAYNEETKGYDYLSGQRVELEGVMQNWAYMGPGNNNPYWLLHQNRSKQKEERVFGTISGNLDLWAGFSFQARANYTMTNYSNNAREYATTFLPVSMSDYGRYWDSASKTYEIYTDYLLNFNNQFGDYSVSATAGWVGHISKGTYKDTNIDMATYLPGDMRRLPTTPNIFETNTGGYGNTTSSKSSNWDKSYLFTAQVGWKEMVYLDASYRRDWYRPYRLLKQMGMAKQDNFGYFGLGANAIISSLVKLPTWFNYMKFRTSYSEVGNSIPNISYSSFSENVLNNTGSGNKYAFFEAKAETNRSFEAGLEMLFLKNRLSFDITYYNATMSHLYMETSTGSGLTQVLNSARVRNQGVEATVAYDFPIAKDFRWKTSYNVSFNDNKILETAYDEQGRERLIQQNVAGAHVRYKVGGSVGDMYVGDFKRDKNGYIELTNSGRPKFDNSGNGDIYVGNMNSKWQMGWSNTFNYKDFQLFFLINGRIGGKVISLTESYLDNYGLSQRTADARLKAEAEGIVAENYGNKPGMVLGDGSGRIVPIQEYYQAIGGSSDPLNYIYSATNFRLRELSLGYTFRDLLGKNKNVGVSFIARNLFFLYKDSPADPDVSLSTGNGLGGFELFNMPSSRSYGLSVKVNF